MNKKGFTLIELIVVIVLLLIISGIIVSSVMTYISASKEKAFDLLEESIKNSAETIFLDKEATNSVSITIKELKDKGYIELEDLKNPITDADISTCEITIEQKHVHDEENNKDLWKYEIKLSEAQLSRDECPCYVKPDGTGGCN